VEDSREYIETRDVRQEGDRISYTEMMNEGEGGVNTSSAEGGDCGDQKRVYLGKWNEGGKRGPVGGQ